MAAKPETALPAKAALVPVAEAAEVPEDFVTLATDLLTDALDVAAEFEAVTVAAAA